MPGTDNNDVFDIARGIKTDNPTIPIVVLTPFSHGIRKSMQNMDFSIFDYVFCWLGNTDLLLSIIKLIEDKMNLENDVAAGVQMILLVEDSIRFYSSILPNLYRFVLQQSLEFSTEALNAQLETLRMRGRPKIVLARTYEEAWDLYTRHKENTLGVISDCRFPRDGKTDEMAGYKLLSAIRAEDEFVPLIMESTEADKSGWAEKCGAHFIDKNSKKIGVDLRRLVRRHFGFGDFVFLDPNTMEEVARIKNLKDLQNNIFTLPKESLLYHITRNNVSRWLCSRALFPISEFLKHITWDSLQDVDAHRQIIYDAIVSYRRMKNQGVVAVFHRDRFDRFSNFARIGEGSLGGKGRGLAFLDHIIKQHPELNAFDNADVMIPKTVVLCTDIFDEFMDTNELYQIALSDIPDEEILRAFLRARLPERLIGDLEAYLDVVRQPIAIRSSSLLEDAHYQPFAGIYSTYMIPYVESRDVRLKMLRDAIKGVYASVFYRDSKAYMTSEMEIALRETQTRFYALEMKAVEEDFRVDDGFNLLKLPVKEAEQDGSLQFIASTYDPYDMVIRDGIYDGGRKLVTFCGVLQQGVFPLPELLRLILKLGRESMRREVEIEFAVKLNPDRTGVFYLLQIRPMVDNKMMLDEDLTEIPDEKTLIRSHNAIGQGVSNEVYDVKTDDYSAYNNPAIADEIDRINRRFLEEGRNYVLVGPGRWGSSDPWLGVPVKWPNISAARVIVESGLTNYRVDPSQGTHFFQNLTSFGVGYFTVNDFLGDGVYNQAFLNSQPAVEETAHVRHVRFSSPVVIKVDGMKKEGVVMLPGVE